MAEGDLQPQVIAGIGWEIVQESVELDGATLITVNDYRPGRVPGDAVC